MVDEAYQFSGDVREMNVRMQRNIYLYFYILGFGFTSTSH